MGPLRDAITEVAEETIDDRPKGNKHTWWSDEYDKDVETKRRVRWYLHKNKVNVEAFIAQTWTTSSVT